MANIIPLKDNTGAQFYPQTHEKAVVDSNGVNLQTKLASITTPTYVTAWDGDSTPVVANIPAGVTVTYNTTSYTGTLAASASTANKTYLVSTGTTDNYNRYVTQLNGSTYSWQNLGSTEIDLSDYATKEELSQLEHKVDEIDEDITVTERIDITPTLISGLRVKSAEIGTTTGEALYYIPVIAGKYYNINFAFNDGFVRFGYTSEIPANGVTVSGYSSGNTNTNNLSRTMAYTGYFCFSFVASAITTAPTAYKTNEGVGANVARLEAQVSTIGGQVTNLDGKVVEINANIPFVSDNKAVNGFFKELYLIGVNYQNVAFVNVQGSASGLVCTFKDSSNNTLASLQSDGPLSDTFISRDSSGAIMLASVCWDGLTTVKAAVNSCTLTAKVASLSNNPNIVQFLYRNSLSNTIPTFTKTTGYGVNSSGEVVSGGSSHFYTSPIAVKGGDCVLVTTASRSGAAIISITDSLGTYYKPVAIYTGTDPDTYFYRVKENGFVAITGYASSYFRLTIFRDSEIAAIYDRFKANEELAIDEMKSVPVDYRKRDSAIFVSADINADWESVDGASKTNSIQYNNITRRKVRCATIVGPSNNGIARIRFSKPVNANLHPFLFSICIGDYSDIVNAPAGDVRLIFYSGSQSFASSRSMKIPLQTATATEEYNTVFNRNGWFCICAFLPSYDGDGVDVGESFDPTNVTGFGVHLINSRNLPVTLHIERMDFLDVVMQKPGIVTIIDNFNTNVPAMADYAYSKGVRLNLSIIPGYYEGASGAPTCASEEEIARLAAQGHFIWNHTWSHPNFNDITVPQIHDQINLAEKWMQLKGYGEGKRIVSIPSARFNTRSCNAALDTNVEMFFHSWVRQKKQVYIPFAPVARLLPTTWLDSDALDAGMSGADIATVALKCLTYKGITVIGFHGTYITNEGGGMANWEAYIDAIAESNAYHYGLDEIRDGQWV